MCEIIAFPGVAAPWKRLSQILEQMNTDGKETRGVEAPRPARLSEARVSQVPRPPRARGGLPREFNDFPPDSHI